MNIEDIFDYDSRINDLKNIINKENQDSIILSISKINLIKTYVENDNININYDINFYSSLVSSVKSILAEKLSINNLNFENISEIATKIVDVYIENLNSFDTNEKISKNDYITTLKNISTPLLLRLSHINKNDLINVLENSREKELSKGLLFDGILNNDLIVDDLTGKKNKKANDKDIEIDINNKMQLISENMKVIILNIKNKIIKNVSKAYEEAINIYKGNETLSFYTESFLGLLADLIGGNLISKVIFNDVQNSNEMLSRIENNGIIHFTDKDTIDKILVDKKPYIKASSVLISGMGKKKSYFFAGDATFHDIIVNIYPKNVMTGIRIKPTEEQLEELRYREYNDKAVVKNGKMFFSKEQSEVVYFGLKINSENDELYYDEISEEKAKEYALDEETKKVYDSDGNFAYAKMNALSFYHVFQNYKTLIKRIFKKDDINYDNNIEKTCNK